MKIRGCEESRLFRSEGKGKRQEEREKLGNSLSLGGSRDAMDGWRGEKRRRKRKRVLPMFLDGLKRYRRGRIEAPIHCVLQVE